MVLIHILGFGQYVLAYNTPDFVLVPSVLPSGIQYPPGLGVRSLPLERIYRQG